jgi:hypothetical protein
VRCDKEGLILRIIGENKKFYFMWVMPVREYCG